MAVDDIGILLDLECSNRVPAANLLRPFSFEPARWLKFSPAVTTKIKSAGFSRLWISLAERIGVLESISR